MTDTKDPSTLQHLLTRVEAATGPDRAIDIGIWRQFEPSAVENRVPLPWLWNVTESIDAALALVKRLLPEHRPNIRFYPDNVLVRLERFDKMPYSENGYVAPEAGAKTAPLAILAALLRALLARSEVTHD